MSCANTYFANQYLGQIEDAQRIAEEAAETAQAWVEDEASDFYPWNPDAIREAMCEVEDKHLERMIKAKGCDKELAKAVREIVVGYWLQQAQDKAERDYE
jgi:hypothetical protein